MAHILPFILLAVGAALFAYGARELRRARASVHWPKVEAVVLRSRIQENKRSCSPSVRYRYVRQGVAYEGERIIFSGATPTASRKEVQRYVGKLREGSNVLVRVCPDDPSVAVIEAGVDKRLRAMLVVSVLLILFGMGGVLGW